MVHWWRKLAGRERALKDTPSKLLAVLRVCRVCSHHCMKVSCWLLLTPWNNFSSFSSSSTFLLTRPLKELLGVDKQKHRKKSLRSCVLLTSHREWTTVFHLINTCGWRCLCYSSAHFLSCSEEVAEWPPSQPHPRSPCWSCGYLPKYCCLKPSWCRCLCSQNPKPSSTETSA